MKKAEVLDSNFTLILKAELVALIAILQISSEQVGYLLILVFFDSIFAS